MKPLCGTNAFHNVNLAGLRIDPQGFCRSRRSHYTGLKVAKATDDLKLPFNESEGWAISGVPDGYGIYDVSWSPNGSYVVFTIRPLTVTENSSSPAQLWAANALDGQAYRVLHRGINSVFHSYSWVNDTTLIAAVVPEEGMEAPAKPTIPIGPRIEDNSEGRESQVRTYQDLLKNSHDVAQFEHYCRSQLMTIELSTGSSSDFLSEPRIYTLISPSPDGQYVLVSWLQPPWSYAVPCGRFPRSTRLFTRSGKQVRVLADLPLAESIPLGMDACREGPRGITWRDDKPAELSWAECQVRINF
jgi:dipeptidyl aminopeptidase/acylaminoacyl peptidase